jgi:hypothetical protein
MLKGRRSARWSAANAQRQVDGPRHPVSRLEHRLARLQHAQRRASGGKLELRAAQGDKGRASGRSNAALLGQAVVDAEAIKISRKV